MRYPATQKSFGPFIVLTGLWILNLLIVFFGSPFLIVNKVREWCNRRRATNVLGMPMEPRTQRSRFFPCSNS